jgi:hypothetical protein
MVSYTTAKIKVIKRAKSIEERSVKELVGSTFKDFKDSNRYVTKKNTSHILEF